MFERMCKVVLFGLPGLLLLLPAVTGAGLTIHHDLQLRFHPTSGEIEVTDRLQLPAALQAQPVFELSAGLQPDAVGGELVELPMPDSSAVRRYQFRGELPEGVLTLRYRGRPGSDDRRQTFDMPVAVIGNDGVYLDGASAWYPQFADSVVSYRLAATLPPGWQGVSVGARSRRGELSLWQTLQPQEDIYLLAAPFHDYRCELADITLETYLLDADESLAQRYLQASARYVALYDELLGGYPYDRFSVVENRWQTGYGMPSFTLLGSRVLRLPFILDSSLPHEIVHNWWGNGVWLDLSVGNWSEGLTAYLADHLLKELAGEGGDYRRKALERYANFAASGRDFPLSAFRARHDDASQAVGYSKALMLFHMLRRELGDEAFVAALRDFYQRYRFRQAAFDDLLAVFAAHGLADASAFQRDWLARPGAPAITLQSAEVDGKRLTVRLAQTQDGPVYPVTVPVAVTLADEPVVRWLQLAMTDRTAVASWEFDAAPVRIDVDPAFDLFRQLLPAERPASLGRLFGAPEQLLVVPSSAPAAERAAWQQLAVVWQQRFGNVRLMEDQAMDELPADTAVWLLGWDNRLLAANAARFTDGTQSLRPDGASVHGEPIRPATQAAVLLDPDTGRSALGFVGARGAAAVAALARKLTHYGSFGRLLFDLPAVDNRLREGLAIKHSPLSRQFGAAEVALRLPVAAPLTGQLENPDAWQQARCQ